MKLKNFYADNFKMIKKCWINQIAMSFFGLFITFPIQQFASRNGYGDIPVLAASAFAICFYLFVVYDSFWEFGGNCQNRQSEKYRTPKQCLLMGACAYLPTLLFIAISLAFFLLYDLAGMEWASGVTSALNLFIGFILRGMYLGIKYFLIQNDDPASYKNLIEYTVNFLSLIPMPLICFIAFKNGQNNKQLFKRKKGKKNTIEKEKLK